MTKFTKILNYIKSSCIIFSTKMFRYSHYIYFLQAKSTHFALRVLTNIGLEVLGHFKLYQVFKHNLFASKCLGIIIKYIFLTRKINPFWSKGFDKFWSMHIKIFWAQKKSYKKNRNNSQEFLNYIKPSCMIIRAKMPGYSQIIYCLQEESTNFGVKDFWIISSLHV